jgi:hypothetical protein
MGWPVSYGARLAGFEGCGGKSAYQACLVVHPLPQLHTSDLGSGSVLHQEVQRNASVASYPSSAICKCTAKRFSEDSYLDILGYSRRGVALDTLVGDASWNVGVQEIGRSYDDFFAANVILVGPKHVLIEDIHGNLIDKRMRNPGT